MYAVSSIRPSCSAATQCSCCRRSSWISSTTLPTACGGHRPGPAASGRAGFLSCKPSDCARKLLHRRQSHATFGMFKLHWEAPRAGARNKKVLYGRGTRPGPLHGHYRSGPSEPWWGPRQPRPCPLDPVPRRSKRGPAWHNRRAIRPKRRNLPPEAHALGRLNRGGCVGYDERGARLQRERPRLQRAPLSLNSTGLLLVAAVRSLLATSPRVITPLPTRIRGGYDGSIGILRT